jgi:hypothetical protein
VCCGFLSPLRIHRPQPVTTDCGKGSGAQAKELSMQPLICRHKRVILLRNSYSNLVIWLGPNAGLNEDGPEASQQVLTWDQVAQYPAMGFVFDKNRLLQWKRLSYMFQWNEMGHVQCRGITFVALILNAVVRNSRLLVDCSGHCSATARSWVAPTDDPSRLHVDPLLAGFRVWTISTPTQWEHVLIRWRVTSLWSEGLLLLGKW